METHLLPERRSAAKGDRASSLGTPTTCGALACAAGLLVHRKYPGESFACLQPPSHSCPKEQLLVKTNSHLNYLQRYEFPWFVHVSNSSKNGCTFRYTVLY